MESQISILYGKHLDFDLTYLSHFSFVSIAQVEIFLERYGFTLSTYSKHYSDSELTDAENKNIDLWGFDVVAYINLG